MGRKELITAIKMLNDEEGLLERIGRSKIKTVGKGTATDALVVEFKATMIALEDAKLLDEAPAETFEFYNDNADEFVADPAAVEDEGTEETEATTETEDATDADGEGTEEAGTETEEVVEGTDEFGFKAGSKASLFAQAIKEKPMTMKEIKELSWNTKNASYPGTWKKLRDAGFGFKDEDGNMAIKDGK